MAWLIIPVTTDANQVIPCSLDGNDYEIQLMWNSRSGDNGGWMLSIYNASGDLLQGAIRGVVNFPLLKPFTDIELPPGELYLWDQSGTDLDPGRDDLGSRVLLAYKEAIVPDDDEAA